MIIGGYPPYIHYQCELCGSTYNSPEKALRCEAIPLTRDPNFPREGTSVVITKNCWALGKTGTVFEKEVYGIYPPHLHHTVRVEVLTEEGLVWCNADEYFIDTSDERMYIEDTPVIQFERAVKI